MARDTDRTKFSIPEEHTTLALAATWQALTVALKRIAEIRGDDGTLQSLYEEIQGDFEAGIFNTSTAMNVSPEARRSASLIVDKAFERIIFK